MTTPPIRRRSFPARHLPTRKHGASLSAVYAAESALTGPPWRGVDWSMMYVGLLAYIWIVTTYSFQGGDVAMAVALFGLVLQRDRFVFPRFLWVYSAFVLWGVFGYASTDFPAVVELRLNAAWKIGLIALVTVNALRSRSRVRFFTFFFLAAYALYPTRGTLFSYVGGGTMAGRAVWNYIYANPNDLAALTLFPLAMSIGVFITEPPGWPKKAALAGIVLLPIVIILTQSRGAFLALTVFALFAITGSRRKPRIIAAVAVILAVVVLATPQSAWHRFALLKNATSTENLEEVDPEGSAEQRFEIWKVATAIIRDNPVSGVGLGAYSHVHEIYAQNGSFSPIARGQRDTHSTYLNVLAETGVVGFALFMGIFGLEMAHTERVRRRIRSDFPRYSQQLLYLNLGLLGYLLAGIFGSFSGLSFPYIYVALLVAMTMMAERMFVTRNVAEPGAPARGAILRRASRR
jgi:probable O-glycosylation ligase (exosortase A-associated)